MAAGLLPAPAPPLPRPTSDRAHFIVQYGSYRFAVSLGVLIEVDAIMSVRL